ncbi:hypothetical protein CBR_g365 [Chara braunii]|uniref:Uncharacterized protein n=1 Tax=Chara braunii TaxID=69332 RepID=A0A388JQF3_CHABU|nr:hypothetical protein CBR_g365 [Chara braunii]|eukprot:GBG60034.1 hypothetical protein CBR_g365 [Chara braunii]
MLGGRERWNRYPGGGIAAGHKNEYRLGVLIRNWVEDEHARQRWYANRGRCRNPLEDLAVNGQFYGVTTHMASFRPEGKTGQDLLLQYNRRDLDPHFGEKMLI